MVAGVQERASLLHGFVEELHRHERFDGVVARLSSPARALMTDLPPPSAWVDIALVHEVMTAIDTAYGAEYLRRTARDVVRRTVLPGIRPALHELLQLFGASPAAIYAKIEMLAGATVRGIEYRYLPAGARAGVMEVAYPRGIPANRSALVVLAAVLELALEVCGTRGTVGEPEVVETAAGPRGRIPVEW